MLHAREIIHISKIIHAGAGIKYSPILSVVSFLLVNIPKKSKILQGERYKVQPVLERFENCSEIMRNCKGLENTYRIQMKNFILIPFRK